MWRKPQSIIAEIWAFLVLLKEAIGLWGNWDFISEKTRDIWGVAQMVEFLADPPPGFVTTSIAFIFILFLWGYKSTNSVNNRLSRESSPSSRGQITISLANPVNQAAEPWLEWLHVQASPNPGGLPETTIAWANLDALVYDLRWQGDHGPIAEQTIRAERPGMLPLVVRSQRDCVVRRTPIQAGICYLTEATFQIHHKPVIRINSGVHKLFVMVRTKENKDAMREFKLIVPPTLNEPVKLEHAPPADRPPLKMVFQKGQEPFEKNDSQNQNIRIVQIRIENGSDKRLEHVSVRIEKIEPSDPDSIFWIFNDSKLRMPPPKEQVFALNPHDRKDVPIAQLDAINSALANLGIELLCHSIEGFSNLDLEQEYNLTVRASAEIGKPIEQKYKLWVNGLKQLCLQEETSS